MTQEPTTTPDSDVAADVAVAETSPVTTPPLPDGPADAGTAPAPGIAARLGAEALGTFMLVFVGVGAALYSSVLGLGQLGIALAFGIAVIGGVAAVGHVSGGHFNPAVTFGLVLSGRHSWRDLLPYWVVQAASGIVATLVLFVASPKSLTHAGAKAPDVTKDLFKAASNGFGAHAPAYDAATNRSYDFFVTQGATHDQVKAAADAGQITLPNNLSFGWGSALLIEIVATAIFVGVILAVTDRRSPVKFQAVVIGLTLTAAVLVAMPVTNSSINPARALASAVWSGGWTWGQLWVFIVGPLVGGAIAALFYRGFAAPRPARVLVPAEADGVLFTDASGQPFDAPAGTLPPASFGTDPFSADPSVATDVAAEAPVVDDAEVLSHGVTGDEQPTGADDATVLSEGEHAAPSEDGDTDGDAEPKA